MRGGSLVGWEAGDAGATPLLVLHGGPLSDYTEPLVETLPGGFRALRYQQRGLPPSTRTGPFDVETHVADAFAVLDERGCRAAWVLGHSWGGHLALHLAVAAPERILGVVAVDGLGAVPDGGWSLLDANIFARLAKDDPAGARRAQELDRRAMDGDASGEEASASLQLVWPYYFADPASAPPLPHFDVNVELYSGVVASVHEHFERGTLERGLPSIGRPLAVIHGEHDPLPSETGRATAALVPGATFELIADAGHFPWLERPDAFRAAVSRALRRP